MRDHFAQFLGMQYALDNENDLLAYSYDASGLEGKARLVLFPSNEEEIRKILVFANRTNIPVVPRGLGTNSVGGVVPSNAIVVDMARLDRVHTVNLKEGWVLVDAGVVLSDLQRTLAKHEREFPVNPQSAGTSTIGALLASNQMDRYSHKNGRLKDYVLSMEIIDGTGKHYPEGNLDFIGMEGAGAFILRAKIKIRPAKPAKSTDILTFKTIPELLASVEEKKDDLTVACLEYINPVLAAMQGQEEKHTLLVGYETEKGELQGEPHEQAWQRRDTAWAVASKHGHPIIEDCQANSENVYEIIKWSERHEVPMAGHIGMGIMHPFLKQEQQKPWIKFTTDVAADPAGQFGYGRLKKAHLPRHKKDLLKKLKDQYDYNDIINRGVLSDYA